MKKTGYLYDKKYLRHETGYFHPEVPERLQAIHRGIENAGLLPKLVRIEAQWPDLKWVEAVHSKEYINRFRKACLAERAEFDSPDNQISPLTFDTAMLAVGGVIKATRLVATGELDNAFCAVRPPGHHAEPDRAMGFCYFNNVAIAARYLLGEYRIGRVGIIDFDVHHGNGTQHIFETDASVFYYSIHQHPSFAYPGTGRDFEKGKDQGTGFTLNSTVLPGQGDEEYMALLKRDLLPAFDSFQPEFIFISAGFDAHTKDDMSDVHLTTAGYSWITKQIVKLAEKYADGRLVSVLEGGYSLELLPELAQNHIRILLSE